MVCSEEEVVLVMQRNGGFLHQNGECENSQGYGGEVE